jgi:hypothetical protein
MLAVSPALLIPSSVDIVSGILALLLAASGRGAARLGFAALSLSHMLKAAPLLGSGLHLGTLLPLLVLLGEVVRAVSASALALYYTKGALSLEEE